LKIENYKIENSEVLIKPKLLLHSCCAPCSTSTYDFFIQNNNVDLFWFNPNVYPQEEQDKRLSEVRRLSEIIGCEVVEEITSQADHEAWKKFISGTEREPEGGKRCHLCYEYRMKKAFAIAKKNEYGGVTTSLLVSPYKDQKKIKEIGNKLAKQYDVKFFFEDFKGIDGYSQSIKLSKKYGLYRQKYCGCEFSLR